MFQNQHEIEQQKELLAESKEDCTLPGIEEYDIDKSYKQKLNNESQNIKLLKEQVSLKEKKLFDKFKQVEQRINRERDNMMKEINEQRKQVEADKIYVAECETLINSCAESQLTVEDQEELNKETEAIEQEKKKIRQQEKEIDAKEDAMKKTFREKMEKAQTERNEDLVELNKDRNVFKENECEWRDFIDKELSEKQKELEAVIERVNMYMEQLDELEKKKELLLEEQRALKLEMSHFSDEYVLVLKFSSQFPLIERSRRH